MLFPLSWLISLLAVLALVLLWLTGERWWLGTLLLFSPRWLLLLPLFGWLLLVICLRRWRATAVASVITLATIVFFVGLNIPVSGWLSSTVNGTPLRLVTINADGKRLDRNLFDLFMIETNPDLILIQDAGSYGRAANFVLGDWHIASDDGNMRVIGRYPVKFVGKLSGPEFGAGRGASRFVMNGPTGAIPVVSVHLPTPRDGFEAFLHRSPKALKLIEDETNRRSTASSQIANWLSLNGDLLVAGDFNTPVESSIYRRDWSSWTNAFSQTGFGFGQTMTARISSVRIDHILYQAPWRCNRCWVGPHVGSAHRPVVADLVLPGMP